MRGRTRCRLHGGLSFGPPPGSQNGLVHGNYTPEAIAARRQVKAEARAARAAVKAVTKKAERATAHLEDIPRRPPSMARPNRKEREGIEQRRRHHQTERDAAKARQDRSRQQIADILAQAQAAAAARPADELPNVVDIVTELEQARQAALACYPPQATAAVAATLAKAKVLGMLIDQSQVMTGSPPNSSGARTIYAKIFARSWVRAASHALLGSLSASARSGRARSTTTTTAMSRCSNTTPVRLIRPTISNRLSDLGIAPRPQTTVCGCIPANIPKYSLL
jgi:hypothetical protein